MKPIPTVEEAQAQIDALVKEKGILLAELTLLDARRLAVQRRLVTIEGYSGGELPGARSVLVMATNAAQWDASSSVVRWRPFYGGADEVREGRLLKVTAKQIHVLTTRGSDHVLIFNRETGKAGKGSPHDPCILNLAEVVK